MSDDEFVFAGGGRLEDDAFVGNRAGGAVLRVEGAARDCVVGAEQVEVEVGVFAAPFARPARFEGVRPGARDADGVGFVAAGELDDVVGVAGVVVGAAP